MSNGVLSLDDLEASSNGGSTDAESNDGDAGDSEPDELEQVCETIGADAESAQAYVDENGSRDSLLEFAKAFRENPDEMAEMHEEYRAQNDQHRIKQYYLLDHEKEFNTWSGNFYGDTDDPEPGTYNAVQQRVRNSDHGNLAFYKALFPEPQASAYPGEPVLWEERPDEDSHIYVPRQFAEEYMAAGCTITVNGEEKPRPPSDEELVEMQDGTDASDPEPAVPDDLVDPRELTVDEIEAHADSLNHEQCEEMLALERQHDRYDGGRKGAKNAIRERIDALEEQQGTDTENTSDNGQQSLTNVASGSDDDDDRSHPEIWDISSEDVAEEVASWSLERCDEALTNERRNPVHDGGRTRVIEPLQDRIREIEQGGGSDAEEGVGEKAGAALKVAPELSPGDVKALHDNGWSKDEIVDFFRGNDVDGQQIASLAKEDEWEKDELMSFFG